MNDIEKAIDALKMDNALMEFDPNTGEERPIESQNELNQYAYKANLLAISTLEKQIPKKPQEVDVDFSTFICPNCLSTIMYTDEKETHNYCLKCGQRLDWSDYEKYYELGSEGDV